MWLYNNELIETIPEGMVGFVYLITNLTNNRKYIGKKNFYFSKTKTVKGKKKKFKVDSDWKNYYGSSAELSADVELFGKENFKREILRFCISKGETSYYEARLQFEEKVLEREDYYNSYIQCRIHQKHLTFLKK
jgi:hypothetical protein